MKSNLDFPLMIMLMLALVLTACSGQPAAAQGFGTAEFLEELKAKGMDAEKDDSIQQPFFSVTGTSVNFNGESVQVFEYDSAETMESDAVLVGASGSLIGTSMVTWVAAPHFYKKGRILALYIGDNTETLEVLESVLGPQFAGD